MTETNFVSEADFEKLLDSLPSQSTENYPFSMQREDWYWYFRIVYGCALRIKEATILIPENFDLEHKILTLPETKTGWKKKDGVKVRKSQRTTILPQDAIDMKSYLDKKPRGERVWPVTRQSIHVKFKKLCEASGLSYFWQKDERAFTKGWPYLLRSTRAKLMVKAGADFSLIQLKMRHKGQSVTFRYTELNIHELLAWEAEHYPLVQVV